ncbi:MAG: hypothetical protein RMJ53_07910, partial [Chitinophagales bacterium]|nr:hypothetical protein [Chitinophagales bacterium]MDW8274137.1 hypothetical protein [Chitinophagales bacterium]
VGDDAFFKSLEYYLKTNAFRAVEIHHLRLAFEEVTGRDLNWFFNQWFMNSGHPNITYHYIYQDDTVKVVAEQEQNTKNGYIFKLPLTVGIWDSSRTLFYDFSFEKKSDTFKIPFRGRPVLVDADVERILLCSRKDAKSLQEYIFQYKHHPNFTAKLEALQRLKEVQKDSPEARDVLLNALNDTFYFFRKFAVESCYFSGADSSYLVDKLKNMALHDRNASVRTAAIQKISRVKDPSLKAFFIQCLNDSSYAATAEALKAINSLDTSLAMELCKRFENENNLEINDAVFSVYANSNSSKYNEFFTKKFSSTKGYAKYILMYHYANYLGNMDKNIVLGGIETLKNHSLVGDTRLLLSAGKGALRRIVKQFEEKKKQVVSDSSSSTASDYETIIYAANEALNALNKKNNEEKRN